MLHDQGSLAKNKYTKKKEHKSPKERTIYTQKKSPLNCLNSYEIGKRAIIKAQNCNSTHNFTKIQAWLSFTTDFSEILAVRLYIIPSLLQ